MMDHKLSELIKPDILQQIQDAFSDYTGMASVITNEDGVPLTTGSHFSDFCTDLIRRSEAGCRNCERSDRSGAQEAMNSRRPAIYKCHAGLVDFAAPIIVNGSILGCLVAGQVVTEDLDESKCRDVAQAYGIDPGKYVEYARRIPRITREQVERSADFLFALAKAISSIALHNALELENNRSLESAARSQSDYIMSVISDLTSFNTEYVSAAEEALRDGGSEKMREALEDILFQGNGFSGMIKDSIAYLRTIGRQFRMCDEEYDPREVLAEITSELQQQFPAGSSISCTISENVPEKLLGDAGNMCQLISKMTALSVERGRNQLSVRVSSSKHSYAEMIHIDITAKGSEMADGEAEKYRQMIIGENEFTPVTMTDLTISVIRSILDSLSGYFTIKKVDNGAEYQIILPQLKIKGGSV